MIKPFSPYLFSSLGRQALNTWQDAKDIAKTEADSIITQSVIATNKWSTKFCSSSYSIPTRAFMYCSRS